LLRGFFFLTKLPSVLFPRCNDVAYEYHPIGINYICIGKRRGAVPKINKRIIYVLNQPVKSPSPRIFSWLLHDNLAHDVDDEQLQDRFVEFVCVRVRVCIYNEATMCRAPLSDFREGGEQRPSPWQREWI